MGPAGKMYISGDQGQRLVTSIRYPSKYTICYEHNQPRAINKWIFEVEYSEIPALSLCSLDFQIPFVVLILIMTL